MAHTPIPRRDAVALWRTMMEFHVDVLEELGHAMAAEHALSVSEFDVLINLTPGEAVRHRDIVERVVLTRSAMTRLIDRLVARGLVRREPDPSDQRGVRVRLTDEGAAIRRAATVTNARVVSRRFAGLSNRRATELRALMGRLR